MNHCNTTRSLLVAFVLSLPGYGLFGQSTQELLDSVSKGDLAQVKKSLDSKANVNQQDDQGRSGLWIAAFKGYKQIAALLLEHKANANLKDKNGASPLLVASQSGHFEIVKLLLAHKAILNAQDNFGRTALIQSLVHEDEQIALYLIDQGADVHARQKNGWSVLLLATRLGRNRVIAKMSQLTRLDLDDVNEYGNNAAELALLYRQESALDVLLANKWPVDHKNAFFKDRTLLHLAAESGNTSAIQNLVKSGAKLDVLDKNQQTPLVLATQANQYLAAKMLYEMGADAHIKDRFGQTALSIAQSPENVKTHVDFIKMFKKNGQ